MIHRSSRAKTLLYLSFPPIFLAVSYLWGYIYYETRLNEWGFNPEQFPITIQRTYVEAFAGSYVLLTRGLTLFIEAISPHIIAVIFGVLIIAASCLALSWIASNKFVQRRIIQLRAHNALRMGHSRPPTFVQRGINGFLLVIATLFAVLLVHILAVSLMIILVTPPLTLAKANARDAAMHKDYEGWPVVTWVSETGQLATGFLMTCSDHWCGIVQDKQSVVVPANQVKRIVQKTPVLTRALRNVEGK